MILEYVQLMLIHDLYNAIDFVLCNGRWTLFSYNEDLLYHAPVVSTEPPLHKSVVPESPHESQGKTPSIIGERERDVSCLAVRLEIIIVFISLSSEGSVQS